MGRRGGRVPRMAAKSSAISSLVSEAEKPLLGATAGGDASDWCAAAFQAPSDLDASGATVAERRVRRFHGRGGCDAPVAPGEACWPWGFSFPGDGVCGCGGGDAEAPSLEQRSRRCVPQLSVGKEKSWRRVRAAAGAGDGDGDDAGAEGAGAGAALAVAWWSESEAPAMRTMRGGERWVGAGGGEARTGEEPRRRTQGVRFSKRQRQEEPRGRKEALLTASARRPAPVNSLTDGWMVAPERRRGGAVFWCSVPQFWWRGRVVTASPLPGRTRQMGGARHQSLGARL